MCDSKINKAAFSLIEIVIAVAIFAFAILAIVGLMGSSLKVTRDSEEQIQAANLAVVIAARYQAMLATVAKGQTVNDWGMTPFDQTVTDTSPQKFKSPKGQYVDALGIPTGKADDAAFGIRTICWAQQPFDKSPNTQMVYCSIQLEWPVAAVQHRNSNGSNVNSYTMTTSFVITP